MKSTSLKFSLILLLALTFSACQNLIEADLIIHNANIYTVDSVFSKAEAMAVKDGKILEVGPEHQILNKYRAAEKIDAGLKSVYPGFIDGHCHFLGYGLGFFEVDLVGTKSWDEVLQRCVEFAKEHPDGWLTGRGWDQNDWEVKEYPHKRSLDSLFPDRPVFLTRIDGHAAIANTKAFEAAEVDLKTTVEGGRLVIEDGEFTGILIDRGVERVAAALPMLTNERAKEALLIAEENCFAAGLTTLSDAGTSNATVEIMKEMHKSGELKMRVYAMLTPSGQNKVRFFNNGPFKSERLNIRSFKFYADGALGSRGAYLKDHYHDDHGNRGLMVTDSAELMEEARRMNSHGFQMNTHCIGDQANEMVLNIYATVLEGSNDKRWRIEHAQVIEPSDLDMFRNYNVIPSVQPTHATSDMYWLVDRLGEERAKGAYAYKDLLEQNGLIALGTDFPVEGIDPIRTFYAAVFRMDEKGFPEGGFQMENALSREEALKGMTIWNAIANFEEEEKGSLEKGKFADFVILDTDIMQASAEKVLETKVTATFVGGEMVFEAED
ncbi:MAG: amidohydrolase [Flavobacteriales bacterium]|nr:amidohydrolase [Flavobacteriales bacterium]